MTHWWNSLSPIARYLLLSWTILSLILICYGSYTLLQNFIDWKIRGRESNEQPQPQELDPSIFNDIEFRTTYKYYKIFSPSSLVLGEPNILCLTLKANNKPVRKGFIKAETIYSWGTNRDQGCGTTTGSLIEKFETPALRPREIRHLKITVDSFPYALRVNNPARLTLHIHDSKGTRTGSESLLFDLKTVETGHQEVRGRITFWSVLLTLLITTVTFLKNILLPLFKKIFLFL